MSVIRSMVILGVLAAASTAPATQIDPALKKILRANSPQKGNLPVIVGFRGKFDVKRLAALRTVSQLERGRAIADAMKSFNATASEKVRGFLAGEGGRGVSEVTPLWITNSLRIHAPKSVVQRLVAMNGIESLSLDEAKSVAELLDDEGNATVAPVPEQPKIGWGIEQLGVPKVWETGNHGEGALVAMIDSGANIKHPDLAPNIWQNPGETGLDANGGDKASNGIDDDTNGFIDDVVGWNFEGQTNDVADDNGHGSQTAGIVGGMGAKGTKTGVAPKATLMILKSCCGTNGKIFESNTWEAIQYAIQNGAKVISMSLSAKPNAKPNYAKWREVGEVELAADIIHVNSAGNLGSGREPHNMGSPATNPPAWLHPEQGEGDGATSMITIGATDKNDKIRRYSSVGPVTWGDVDGYGDFPYEKGMKPGLLKPEVCGPSEVPSTSKDGTSYTKSFGGTSSATPHIAGVVALMVAANPKLSVAGATEILEKTALRLDPHFSNTCGAGRVDASAAVEMVKKNIE